MRVALRSLALLLPAVTLSGCIGLIVEGVRVHRQRKTALAMQAPALCAPGAAAAASDEDMEALVRALREGHMEPAAFQQCAQPLLGRLTPPLAAQFMAHMGAHYRRLLRDKNLEQDPVLQAQLQALHQVYLHRPNGISGSQKEMDGLFADLATALAKKRLSPMAARYGQEILATVDLERGQWQGAPVNAAALDKIAAQKDEELLMRFAHRLPDAALRTEARRRVIRLRQAAMPFPELRPRAAVIEEAALMGACAVSMSAQRRR